MEFKKFIINGNEVKYRNSDESILMPVNYQETSEEFRGAWVSKICNDFQPSPNKEKMMNNLLEVLKYFEMMNMNAIVFHLRTYNNAYYKTKKAPIDPSFGTYETFEEWDYLPWFIEECHKRNIEFHAWLNPYRISRLAEGDTTAEGVANLYKEYKNNPASNPENILVTNTKGAILNPCKDEVINYIIDVCMEIIENYNVDAIHFDDYFYAQLTDNMDFINEDDQKDYIDFIKNNKDCQYKENDVQDKMQWRRENVNKFIHDLSTTMKNYNDKYNRHVQLGISPTGIYKNGDGKVSYDEKGTAITNGSNTIGQEHFQSYLFCDTKKWIDEEWIDYVIPQTYWGFTHPVAGFADVLDWWDKVVENKKVNLYSGMGIYMSHRETTYSWYENKNEVCDQVLYCNKLSNVQGNCIFNFKCLVDMFEDEKAVTHESLINLKNTYWKNKIKAPITKAGK